jgi:hypothetical protein
MLLSRTVKITNSRTFCREKKFLLTRRLRRALLSNSYRAFLSLFSQKMLVLCSQSFVGCDGEFKLYHGWYNQSDDFSFWIHRGRFWDPTVFLPKLNHWVLINNNAFKLKSIAMTPNISVTSLRWMRLHLNHIIVYRLKVTLFCIAMLKISIDQHPL